MTSSPPPRTIDENTKLSDLNDLEIADLTQQIKAKESASKPLVGQLELMAALADEYEGADTYSRKIDSLEKKLGWHKIRRTRGDGDCWYRSFAFAYVERLVGLGSSPEASRSTAKLESLMPLLDQVGFARDIVDDFYQPFRDLLLSPPSAADLLIKFNDPEISNSCVVFLRLLTSAYLQANVDDFLPFLFGLEDDPRFFDQGAPTMQQFCTFHVEAISKEADHIQIAALTRALAVHLRVAYLDQSSSVDDLVDFHDFETESSDKLKCALLYRPGHYDLIYQHGK